MSEEKSYNVIFKSTFLFGFVQVFNIAIKVILNKVAAITLGAQGVGLVGLYTSAIGMLKTGTGLGISQSAVRDISEANEVKDYDRFSRTIITTNTVIIVTALLGIVVTIILAPFLSQWTFGTSLYTSGFLFVSLAVAFTTLWEGQLAILKGMRRLRLLAKANIFGAAIGLVISVPLYLIYEMRGIVPVLIITPLCSFICSNYYVRKIEYKRIKISYKEMFQSASPMIKMGLALSFATFLSQISTFLISVFIGRGAGGLVDIGFYNAGIMIMVGYFSVVINALTTDYYPRIAAVNHDNIKIQGELNQQSIVSLLISFPLIVLFLFLLPVLVTLLYSKEFYPIIDFVRIGIYGTLITICSNQVDLILIAKNDTKVYTIIAVIFRVIELVLTVFLYKTYGLVGLGIAILLTGFVHLVIMVVVVKKLYNISFDRLFVKTSIWILLFVFLTSLVSTVSSDTTRYAVGAVIFISACYFSYYYSKKYLNFNILKILSKY